MRLGAFFDRVTPYLEGRIDHAEASAALWPGDPAHGGVDGERLAIYARFCRTHRFEVLALFSATRLGVLARAGDEAWTALVEDYFVAHPMRHFELFENGAECPDGLREQAEARGLPAWLAEVATIEWWTWRAEYGLDPEGPGAGEGPLRISPHLELRPVSLDLADWIERVEEDEAAASTEPRAGERVVLAWRDRDLEGRFANARPVELAVLKMVSEGMSLAALASATGVAEARLASTVDALRAAGILDGR